MPAHKDFRDWIAARFDTPPPARLPDDGWARLCCELAWQAGQQGCYPVGAVLVNGADELVCSAANQVFDGHYQSQRHAEMELLDQFERYFADQPRDDLTLYVSLEPCLMCTGRILLSGIRRVRYLAADKNAGFARHMHGLPPAMASLAARTTVSTMLAEPVWTAIAGELVRESADSMRQQVVKAWQGQLAVNDVRLIGFDGDSGLAGGSSAEQNSSLEDEPGRWGRKG
ncbi:nucleoside deaminase [Oceanobacter mangrovi]|uniref:nucleoside deaminase n=1 Tax=Oceanobacter mangrovi TaxID=2862510 RepID=UPI001C8DA97E|nr:nucleoside deaminase [Oceanobacter mangrovi]